MGFFETLYKGMIETGAKSIEEKYNKMPLDQLKKEWKDTFAHRDYSMREMYAEKSPVGILVVFIRKEHLRKHGKKNVKSI